MLTRNLDEYKISTTKQAITSFAGLPLLLGMARCLGLEEKLNALPLKERERGYSPAEITLTLMGLLQSGGVALDDVSLLRGDEGMFALLGQLPAANTLGEYLRRYSATTVYRLGQIQLGAATKVIRSCLNQQESAIDNHLCTVPNRMSNSECNFFVKYICRLYICLLEN